MGASGLTLRGLRTLYARRPAALVDVIAALGARTTGDGLVATVAPSDLADAAEALLTHCPDPSQLPLWGVPVAVGDTLDVAGLATAHGLPALAEMAEGDAPAVARLRAAGAIIIGKSAVSPLGIEGAAGGAITALAAGRAALVLTNDHGGIGLAAAARAGVAALAPTANDEVGPEGLLYLAGDGDALAAACGLTTAIPPCRRIAAAEGTDAVATDTVPAGVFAELAALADDPALLALASADLEPLFAEAPQLFGPLRRRLDRAFAASATALARALTRRARLGRALRSIVGAFDAVVCEPSFAAAPGMAGLPAITLAGGRLLIGPDGSDGALIATAGRLAGTDGDASPGPIDIPPSSTLVLCALSDLTESSGRQEIAP